MNERARDAADQALRTVREGANAAGGTFGRLEQAIEERIARTLGRMGVITRAEVNDLSAQLSELAEEMRLMNAQARSSAGARASAPARAGKAKRKPGRVKAAAKKRRARHH